MAIWVLQTYRTKFNSKINFVIQAADTIKNLLQFETKWASKRLISDVPWRRIKMLLTDKAVEMLLAAKTPKFDEILYFNSLLQTCSV